MSASSRAVEAAGQAGWWPAAFLACGEPDPGSTFLWQRWKSVLSSFRASGSVIHQKVLRGRSGVSGFLNYQLAIPGLGMCQLSPSSPGAPSSRSAAVQTLLQETY